jgi:chemotaxis protein MotB
MVRVWKGLLAALTLSVLTAGCQNKVYDENQALRKQNLELQSQMDVNHSRSDMAQAPVTTPQNTLMAQQPVQQAPPPAEPMPANPKPPRARPDLGNLEVTEDARAGTTTVSLPGDLFFDSGSATLKESAKKSLDKVAAALRKDYANKPVRIEGHTDSDPIVHSKWKNNQELSEKRALAVKTYLVSKGIPDSRIHSIGYGDTKPRNSNKAQNRRVEVVVLTR